MQAYRLDTCIHTLLGHLENPFPAAIMTAAAAEAGPQFPANK